ncbi:RNA methyltransferase [Cellvibrio sp. UBA7661]|uniref:RNA methyltransferase n=1 Tax=Cellvibrio sp. UBA7661 TaxID=1946311 RepID=UPI002F34F7BA
MQKTSAYIGLVNPKSPTNVGMVMRAAGCFEVDAVFYSGTRFERARKFATDTKNAQSKIPLTHVDNLPEAPIHRVSTDNEPANGIKRVAIELIEGATPLMDFVHPEQAYYIFGPEDGSLKKEILDACDHVVYIPTIGCMNLAATVHVVLYDRMSKAGRDVIDQRPISENRDVNNKIRI